MQAIARVNRVFKDKPGGLVVDYLGIANELKLALATYTESGGKGRTALPQEEAVAVMLEKVRDMRWLVPRVRLVSMAGVNSLTGERPRPEFIPIQVSNFLCCPILVDNAT